MMHAEYFQSLREALQYEWDTEKKMFEGYISSATPKERTRTGLTRYPLAIKDHGMAGSGVFFLDLQPAKPGQIFPQPEQGAGFGGGRPIRLFTKDDAHWMYGVIRQIRGEIIRVYLPVPDLPDEFFEGHLGLDLRFDQRAFEDMMEGLHVAEKARNQVFADLRDVLLGLLPPRKDQPLPLQTGPIRLNPVQEEAVTHILSSLDVACVHGPPGTGKTATLVATLVSLVNAGKSLLVSAASNAAVDHIAHRAALAGLSVVRLGNPARVGSQAESLTLDELRRKHPLFQDMHALQKKAAEAFRQADKYKRVFNADVKQERAALRQLAKTYIQEAEALDTHISRDIVSKAELVCTTLTGTSSNLLHGKTFDYLVLDEATQAQEPSIWLALQKAKALVLAGDPQQLPPTIKDERAKKILEPGLMEKIMHQQPESTRMLTVQYRMHPTIMQFPSQWRYQNKLEAAPEVLKREELTPPLHFYDSAGSGMEEQVDETTGSLRNDAEAALIQRLYHLYRAEFPDWSIGVITPYRAQVKALLALDIPADTIDGFQGQERDLIFISMVRSNPQGECGFLKDERRMNVAFTRAKHKLVVLGDSATLGQMSFFRDWLAFVEEQGVYDSVWSLSDWG